MEDAAGVGTTPEQYPLPMKGRGTETPTGTLNETGYRVFVFTGGRSTVLRNIQDETFFVQGRLGEYVPPTL